MAITSAGFFDGFRAQVNSHDAGRFAFLGHHRAAVAHTAGGIEHRFSRRRPGGPPVTVKVLP
jgi:hypothetical protein